MDHPVISPWLIYLISVLYKLEVACAALAIMLVAVLTLGLIIFFMDHDFEDFMERWKVFAGMAAACLFFTGVSILIPSRNEMYAMILAKEITYERVANILKEGKDLRHQLLEDASFIIQQLRCSPEEGKNSYIRESKEKTEKYLKSREE